MMGVLIRNGTVVTAEKTFAADILIEGETIKEVRAGIPAAPAHHTLDASGMLLLPGGIDAHTHLDMPFGGTTSSDDFEKECRDDADYETGSRPGGKWERTVCDAARADSARG